jgi:seryl-tRNA synthetase
MLDIKFIRENLDIVKAGALKKRIEIDLDSLVALDDERKALMAEVEKMRSRQNEVSLLIVNADDSTKNNLLSEMRVLKEELQQKETTLEDVMKRWKLLMLQVPNVPDMSVPEGVSDEDNVEVKVWGEKTEFSFEPKNHIDIMTTLDMLDLDRGTKVAGFRGYFLKGDGALLSYAIWHYAHEFFLKRNFVPLLVPSLVKQKTLLGTGYIPQGEDDLYKTQDGDYLAGTAEVATMGFHMDEVLEKEELPKRYLSFSPCFRREAGSHGKDVKGLIRVHEFYKVEQVVLCEASHEESVKYHEELNKNIEEFIESLGIPYHTVANCGGDIGLGQVKKYDVELWVPLEQKYREIGSASYFHDFQTRRLNIKYKDSDGKQKYVHSLNSTAIPTPRILVSLVENYQQEDGSVLIPEVLRSFMGGRSVIKKI